MNRTTRQEPSVGRIVHYVAPGSADGRFPPAHRAALITEDHGDFVVSLAVINPTGIFFGMKLAYDESDTPAPFTWHWPERN